MNEIFTAVEARPKRRHGITGQTIESQMRGTMCQITEYELDVLREEIARLTAERDTALKEQERLAKAWEAKHEYQVKQSKDHAEYFDKSQRRIHELVAERDTARAETDAKVAMAFELAATSRFGWWFGFDSGTGEPDGNYCSVDPDDGSEYYVCAKAIATLTPAHATAALAARDKATREQALREAVWQVRSSVPGHMLVADTERICAAILALIEKETSA